MLVTPITPPVHTVGEGPHWEESSQSLLYVDIQAGDVHRWNSVTCEDVKIHLDGTVGFVVPRRSGDLVVGLNRSFVSLDPVTKKTTVIGREIDVGTNNRINDGKCDAAGRIWAGTMDRDFNAKSFKPEIAALYRIDKNGDITQQIDKITVSNGLAWTADNKTMYYIDSVPRKVYAFDFNLETGSISNRRVAVDIGDWGDVSTLGFPDGMTIDTDGKLWVAFYGGGKVIRFDPETGNQLRAITFPAKLITSCCFGGKNYDELYVTSSRLELTEEEITATPLAGAVFKVTGLGVRGSAPHVYEG